MNLQLVQPDAHCEIVEFWPFRTVIRLEKYIDRTLNVGSGLYFRSFRAETGDGEGFTDSAQIPPREQSGGGRLFKFTVPGCHFSS
jgi:hypothetical protein